MAEQTFKSPGFFEREIEVISRPLTRNLATPVGVIGPAEKGPALVPTTVTSSEEFIRTFGSPDQNRSAAHAVVEFFENGGQAATFCRILGTGSSAAAGTVNYAGFKIDGTALDGVDANRAKGAVQFIVADHRVNPAEHVTLGILNDNDSITTTADTDPSDNSGVLDNNTDLVQLVRAMIFMEKDHTLRVTEVSGALNNEDADDIAETQENTGLFELRIVKASDGEVAKSYVVSLDPKDDQYISKVLNTDPFGFDDKLHFLYADFPVDDEIASTKSLDLSNAPDGDIVDAAEKIHVAVLRGRTNTNLDAYGNFSARYSSPKTTQFISQPFGTTEYPLFHVESLDDGAYASGQYKLSIADLRASTEKNYKYGTFTVQLRDLKDTDSNPVIYESYTRCTLDPNAKNFVARLIGDQKIKLSLDVDDEDEKRLVREGTFANQSRRIRVVMSDEVLRGEVPDEALPFGFKGIPTLKTTTHGKDGQASDEVAATLLEGKDSGDKITRAAGDGDLRNKLAFAVLPPLHFRSKVTLGSMQKNGKWFQEFLGQSLDSTGQKVTEENVSTSLYWGLMNTRVDNISKPNDTTGSSSYSKLTENLCKMLGAGTGTTFSGASADAFNNNKFSLAKVAFSSSDTASIGGSVQDAFLEAFYVRNADVGSSNGIYDAATHMIDMGDTNDPFKDDSGVSVDVDTTTLPTVSAGSFVVGRRYKIKTVGNTDFTTIGAADSNKDTTFEATGAGSGTGDAIDITTLTSRATLAKLLVDDPVKFNRYSLMAKFTAPFYGGFDGVNILNRDDYFFTDRSSSQDAGGHAAVGGYPSGLDATDDTDPLKIMQGSLLNNNAVLSFRNAVKLMTDEMIVDHSVLIIPGIRESLITDYASRRVRHYGKAIYLMDIPHYTSESSRIFVSSAGLASGRPDVDITSSIFDSREVDSSYVAAYFPDVMMVDRGDDENARLTNQRLVRVPSSVVALGAIARSDSATRSPWFAPAGFSRGALSSVRSTDVRLNAGDRDTLYEARINPIANFPNNQFVIFGQKTTQIARTSLDRVNVRRLMIYIKRKIQKIAQGLLFEQNDSVTRTRFITATSEILQAVQIGQGIEDYRVIMDDSNNTDEDVDNNRLNGRIIVVPTRAVEFIAMDFVITNSGVEFP